MRLWQSLTRRRDVPTLPTWMAATALLLLAAYAGWAAVRPEGPSVAEHGYPADLVHETRELLTQYEALTLAIRDHDRDRVEQLNAQLEAGSRRMAERHRQRAAAVTTARTGYGLIAALNFAVGAWLLIAARRSRPE